MRSTYIGIDPGKSGAIAIWDQVMETVEWIPLSYPEQEIWDFVKFRRHEPHTYVLLEKVWAHKGQGISSTFNFGANYGLCRGICTALSIPSFEIAPQAWQPAMECVVPTGTSKTGKKNHNKSVAERHFEGVTKANCDALLLAMCMEKIHESLRLSGQEMEGLPALSTVQFKKERGHDKRNASIRPDDNRGGSRKKRRCSR